MRLGEAFRAILSMNPTGVHGKPLGRHMVETNRARYMQHLTHLDSGRLEPAQQIGEHASFGLEGAGILGGIDGVELDAQRLVGCIERCVVGIGQNHELKMLLQIRKSRRRIRMNRPACDRGRELFGGLLIPIDTEKLGKRVMHAEQHLPIADA